MIFFLKANAQFLVLLGTLVAVVVGVVVHDVVVALVARALGDPLPGRRGLPTWRPRLGVYAIVAAVLAVWTWTTPVPVATYPKKWRPRATIALLSGIVTYVVLAGLAAAVFKSLHPELTSIPDVVRSTLILNVQGTAFLGGVCLGFLLLAGGMLLPVPPTDLGRVLFIWAPTNGRWQRARELLVDGDAGVYVLLALAVVPAITFIPSPVRDLLGPLVGDLLGVVGLNVLHL